MTHEDDESTVMLDISAVQAARSPRTLKVRRLRHTSLPSWTRAKVRQQNLLASWCARAEAGQWCRQLCAAVEAMLEGAEGSITARVLACDVVRLPAAMPNPAHALSMNFSAVGVEAFGLMQVELGWVAAFVGQMLHEPPHELDPRAVSPVTPHDFGLITYLGLNVVSRLRATGLHAPLTIEATPPTPTQLRGQFEQGQGHTWRVALRLEHEGYGGDVQVWLPEQMVRLWMGQDDREGEPVWGVLAATEVQAEVGLGSVMLGAMEWAQTQAGDVVLPQTHGMESLGGVKGGGWLGVGGGGLRARAGVSVVEGRWQVEVDEAVPYAASRQGRDDTAQQQESDPMATMHLEDEATVEVEIRLIRFGRTVKECASWAPGSVVELPMSLEEPVEVVVQGRVVARGELVDVEGHLGVRIVERF